MPQQHASVLLTDPDFTPDLPTHPSPQPLRRSTRVRRKPPPDPIQNPSSSTSPPPSIRLEQIPLQTPASLGLPPTCRAASQTIRIHPAAAAMISIHAHLTRTEVIGYLAGVIHEQNAVTQIIVAEAFPAQCLTDRTLARTGRSAYTEVEISPESAVEVVTRVALKGLSLVGWYHSHPDPTFTVEPSRVDIENQHNYQTYMFKDAPFVAAIIAPYNEELPDHKPDLQFFQVHDTDVPVKLPCSVEPLYDLSTAIWPAVTIGAHRPFPLDALLAESFNLVSSYAAFPKRVRLHDVWRGEVTALGKLRRALEDLVQGIDTRVVERERDVVGGQALLEDVERFGGVVVAVVTAISDAWRESRAGDEERKIRNREARKKKKRRRN